MCPELRPKLTSSEIGHEPSIFRNFQKFCELQVLVQTIEQPPMEDRGDYQLEY